MATSLYRNDQVLTFATHDTKDDVAKLLGQTKTNAYSSGPWSFTQGTTEFAISIHVRNLGHLFLVGQEAQGCLSNRVITAKGDKPVWARKQDPAILMVDTALSLHGLPFNGPCHEECDPEFVMTPEEFSAAYNPCFEGDELRIWMLRCLPRLVRMKLL